MIAGETLRLYLHSTLYTYIKRGQIISTSLLWCSYYCHLNPPNSMYFLSQCYLHCLPYILTIQFVFMSHAAVCLVVPPAPAEPPFYYSNRSLHVICYTSFKIPITRLTDIIFRKLDVLNCVWERFTWVPKKLCFDLNWAGCKLPICNSYF